MKSVDGYERETVLFWNTSGGLPVWELCCSFDYSGQGTHMSEALSKRWLLWPSCYFCSFPVHALSFLSHTGAWESWPRILKACHTTGHKHLCGEKVTKHRQHHSGNETAFLSVKEPRDRDADECTLRRLVPLNAITHRCKLTHCTAFLGNYWELQFNLIPMRTLIKCWHFS